MEEENKRTEFNYLMGEAAQSFEEQSKRIENILSKAQRLFERDFSTAAAGLGAICTVTGAILGWFEKPAIVSASLIIGGILLVMISMWNRSRNALSLSSSSKMFLEIEKERANVANRSIVLKHVWLYGLPPGVSGSDIGSLLGNQEIKSLPAPKQNKEQE